MIGSRNRRAVTVASAAALVALTRSTVNAETNPAYGVYTYIGCYLDAKDRAMPYTTPIQDVDLDLCAAHCMAMEYAYMGLEFSHECFCGDSYDKYGPVELDNPDHDQYRCDMTLETDSDVEAGGWWTMSVYELPQDADMELSLNAVTTTSALSSGSGSGGTGESHQEGTDAGGETVVEDDGLGPVESGQRAFTVVNECSQTIRIGATGGRITFGSDTDPALKENCDDWGPSAVYNNGPMGIGCFWDFPPEESGNTDRMLEPGKSFRYPLYDTDSDTRWSGTIWASTGCDETDGCQTGVCYYPETDHVCPAYVGPGGPTTKAEFTLSDGNKDYYDVSAIDGTNLPMMIEPDDPVYPTAAVSKAQHIKKYECGNPGSPTAHHEDLADCTWSYENVVSLHGEDDLSPYLRLVHPEDYENPVSCTTDADCPDATCGVHPQRWADGSYKGGVEQNACGRHIAWVSAGGACAGGWVDGEFPDAYPFYCGAEVTGGMRANMYGCHGGVYAHSGYTPGADTTACGCPEWEDPPFSLTAPPISECTGINPEWVELAMPWAAHLKKACPTAYTFPYDDQTSTYTCYDGDGPGADDYVNTQSYTITFCPGDSEANFFG